MTLTVLIPIALYLASGLVNYALAFKSPEQWADYAERYPAGAAVRKALRQVGFDLPGLIRLGAAFLAQRAARSAPGAPAGAPTGPGAA